MSKRFGVMLDMSRNAVMKPSEIKRFADVIKSFGYNMIQIYTEDTYEVEGEPYFGYLRGRYSKDELRDVVSYCNSIGIEVIPCIQTLAHLNQIFMWDEYKKIQDVDDILLVDDERTYELIDNMFKSVKECFTNDIVHIGMDEAHMLGLGKFFDRHGAENRFDILHRHLEKVIEIAKKYELKPIMWSDMFFRLANKGAYVLNDTSLITDEVIAAKPDGVDLVYWDYYSNDKQNYDIMLDAHKKFGGETWFAGGAWSWRGFAANNEWTLRSMTPAMSSCKEKNIDNIFITMWGDDGKECSYWSLLPSLFAIKKIYDGENDMEKIKSEFKSLTGEAFDDMMLLDLPVDIGACPRNERAYHKYLLYSDAFLGFLDSLDYNSCREEYEALANRLESIAKISDYGYIYESHAALCRTLALKHDLGKRTREAYKSGDSEKLDKVIEDFSSCVEALEVFIDKFRKLWLKENKPHGFDVQEIRLGGLLLRLRSQKERLVAYRSGEVDKIDELCEELLEYIGQGNAKKIERLPVLNSYLKNVSPNVM